jgi:peptidoglycan/xylan/chitin deacetylase (PgdA/CDA1 family)
VLTIVMYHYARDLARSRFPAIKGLSLEKLDGQLDYIARHYTVVGAAQVRAAVRGGKPLPANACWLSFDDGLIDHYTVVLPRLVQRGMTASFFPVARSVLQGRVLDVHKIHFILASCRDPRTVMSDIAAAAAEIDPSVAVPTVESLNLAADAGARLDPPEIILIKRALQRDLPRALRAAIVDQLFAKYVSADEIAFARELYVDLEQLRLMHAMGMDIGSHGDSHAWLNALTPAEQEAEIAAARAFLALVHAREPEDWTMCYPFGGYDQATLEILPRMGCALGLTTRVGLAADLAHPLELPRLDTIDLPVAGDADVCDWTRRALAA